MSIFSWAKATPLKIHKTLPANSRIYFISDLHLGDGTRSDAFTGKDRELIQLIEQVRKEEAQLVIVGDAIDFHQAWAMSRVLRAHAQLIGELARLAESNGVTYIWGNHDHDISLFKDLLNFNVCSTLFVGEEIKVSHGYEYDPFIGPNLEKTHVATRVHHLFERIFDTWIRLPLENFYTLENRAVFWLFHKFVLFIQARDALLNKIGLGQLTGQTAAVIQHWTQNQIGDPACIFEGVREAMRDGPHRWVVTGHSHFPGNVKIAEDRTYINTGSWTFNSAQYALWDGEKFEVRDWVTKKIYTDVAYQPLIERRFKHMGFLDWWRENYMGWLRFRVGEAGRVKQPS